MSQKFCALYQTSNVGFQPMPSNPETCITYSCPNSTITPMDEYFQQTKWGSNINNSCMKPLADAEVSKQYRCDERWYDWFTIPNHHLGNGFINPDPANPGKCFNPCAAGSLPAYQTDPVDGQNLHVLTNKDNTENCISRADYFGGKYADGSDHCPLAWIYILNSTPKSLEKLVNNRNQTFKNSDMASNVITDAFINNQQKAIAYADNIFKKLPIELNNIYTPSSYTQNACNRIETPARLQPAYDICMNLMNNEPSVYETFAENLPAEMARNKVIMLKQACNAVFCNLRDPAPRKINKKSLCFKNVGTFNPSTGEVVDKNKRIRPIAPQPTSQQSYMYGSIKTAIYVILLPLLAYLLYIFFTDALYPYVLMPLYVKSLVFFGFEKAPYDEWAIKLQESKFKIDKYAKQCKSNQNEFNEANKKLREENKPELPMPLFPKCEQHKQAIAEDKDLKGEFDKYIDKIQLANATTASSSGPGAGSSKGEGKGKKGGGIRDKTNTGFNNTNTELKNSNIKSNIIQKKLKNNSSGFSKSK